jgi:hypothetical protein
MSLFKEFFNKRVLINCLVFSMPVSLLFMWRFTHLRGIPFFSTVAAQIYSVFVGVDYLIILFVFLLLFWLSRRRQQQ